MISFAILSFNHQLTCHILFESFPNIYQIFYHSFLIVFLFFHLQMITVTRAPLQTPPHWSRRPATTLVLHLNPWQLLRVTAMTWKVTNILPNSLLVRNIRVVSHCNESSRNYFLSFDVNFNCTFLFSEQNHCSSESRTAKRDSKSHGDSEHFLDSSKSSQVHANSVTCIKVKNVIIS